VKSILLWCFDVVVVIVVVVVVDVVVVVVVAAVIFAVGRDVQTILIKRSQFTFEGEMF